MAGKKYQLYNEHDVLYLPLHVPVGIPMLQFMADFFKKYISLLEESKQKLKECNIDDTEDIIKKVVKFQDAYIQMHASILSGKADEAYQQMEKVLNEEYFIKVEINNQESPLFYRARSGINWTQEEDFYHVPFNKTYLCNSYRFSIAGYPSLYLGFSKEVCKKEQREKECSCIELKLKKKLNVVDLTWSNTHAENINNFLYAYPIIAACYVVPFYCKNMGKECPEIDQRFKEQYIFPQFITMYIKKYLGVEGIVYYTTRDENIDPSKDDDKNIALFPSYTKNILYDNELIDKFKWGNIAII